jgi:hypothetical protein
MAQPCKECGRRPKAPGRHRCLTCQLRNEPVGDQAAAAARRLAMVPPELRRKRTKAIMALAPAGTAWCAGCQSFRDDVDFGKGATTCRACSSAKSHATRIEKTYGITSDDYATLLKAQGGKCAICRARPKSKRLAVDHDHRTGAVRGLLCSRCNHDLLGSAWDSLAMAAALWHYMNTPPARGGWLPPEQQAPLSAERPPADPIVAMPLVTSRHEKPAERGAGGASEPQECQRPPALPVGAISVPGKRGVFKVWVEPGGETPPF